MAIRFGRVFVELAEKLLHVLSGFAVVSYVTYMFMYIMRRIFADSLNSQEQPSFKLFHLACVTSQFVTSISILLHGKNVQVPDVIDGALKLSLSHFVPEFRYNFHILTKSRFLRNAKQM